MVHGEGVWFGNSGRKMGRPLFILQASFEWKIRDFPDFDWTARMPLQTCGHRGTRDGFYIVFGDWLVNHVQSPILHSIVPNFTFSHLSSIK
ncbi:hypothetical protein [Alicyclobacillus fodiniaquatilis]|uniref:Uncharacterized protein n=1 Tax=Alicyclobacillus fodiniaquatilis TaxID=1661150 RepID=A0ABW4JPZ2_9BACL